MSYPTPRTASRRLMLRALHALVRAQLRQRGYLQPTEVQELESVAEELRDHAAEKPLVYYCTPCQRADHSACLGGDCRCAARDHAAFEREVRFIP